jgi:hypothetical protein
MLPFSFFQRKQNNPVHPKEIFETIWPDGYESKPLYGQEPDYYKNLGITPSQHPVYVSCPKCHRHISSSTKTKYSNPISHITTCCSEVSQVYNLVRAAYKDAGLDNGSKAARQQKLHKALCQANPQDLALHTWMKLVCLHNTSIYKINNSNICDVLSCAKTSHKTFTNTMLELSLIVEEKITAEMRGKRGIIVHDGWSKYSRHYACLLATYLVDTGKIDVLGQEVIESINTLLTVTTLPHDDEENDGKLSSTEIVIVFSTQPYSHIYTCL